LIHEDRLKAVDVKGGNKGKMKDKRWFIGYLKGLYRDENAPELKKLITELKKRRLEFYTHPEGHKLLIIPQRQKWHRNKTVVENGMPDYFDMSIEDRRYEVLLMWPEVLGSHPEAAAGALQTFLADVEEDETPTYIQ